MPPILENFNDIDITFDNVLLGNGFSINISNNFNYRTLFEHAVNDDLIDQPTQELFDHFKTKNFEEILRYLLVTKEVNSILSLNDSDHILSLKYDEIRDKLYEVLNLIHPGFQTIQTQELSEQLLNFKNIFTTNYDLILYWSIQERRGDFKDFFWSNGNSFNSNNVQTYESCNKLYFMHGAVHLREDIFGITKKLINNFNGNILSSDHLGNLEFPLIVTEGDCNRKLEHIYRNSYLKFCYESLIETTNNLLVLGHSLNKEYDGHILKAIAKSNLQTIAIGIYKGDKSNNQIIQIKSELSELLNTKNVRFFDISTNPFFE